MEIQQSLNKLRFSDGISASVSNFDLVWSEKIAGFDIFDIQDPNGKNVAIGDDADYLQIFMTMSDKILTHQSGIFEPLVIAGDAGGKRLFVRLFSQSEKEAFKYAYVALGHAAKKLPAAAINGSFGFFGEITLESAAKEGFEKEAKKVARTLKDDVKQTWEKVAVEKRAFLKTDLYVFHLLKLYSWGFQVINQNGKLSPEFNLVRPQPGKPRGASRR
jgi:hypothetical protein